MRPFGSTTSVANRHGRWKLRKGESVSRVKALTSRAKSLGDVPVAEVPADHVAVPGLDQRVVIAASGARLRELRDLEPFQHLDHPVVDVLRAVVGVEAPYLEGTSLDELLEHGHKAALRDGAHRRHVLPLRHLVDHVDVVHALFAGAVPLVHRVDTQEARPTLRPGLAALADRNRSGPCLRERGAAAPVGRGVAQVVELAVRDAGQTREALVAVLLEHPPHHRARGVPAQLAQRLVDPRPEDRCRPSCTADGRRDPPRRGGPGCGPCPGTAGSGASPATPTSRSSSSDTPGSSPCRAAAARGNGT